MKNKQILEKVAELVGLKFSNKTNEVKFAMVELEGGFIVSNQKDDDFVVGDTIYLVNEDGTYSVVGSGDWTYLDGSKSLKTDEEGTLVEISADDVEETTEEEMEEVSVDIPEEVEDVVDENVVENIVDALTPIIEEIKVLQEELMNFKKDYQKFKESATHTPLKEDKVVSKAFSTDSRYEVLKAMKEANKR